jgi:hypothetical protein
VMGDSGTTPSVTHACCACGRYCVGMIDKMITGRRCHRGGAIGSFGSPIGSQGLAKVKGGDGQLPSNRSVTSRTSW